MSWTDLLGMLGFIAVCAVAAASGALFKPGDWYDGLIKPSWVPPKWAFPVVWTLLYVTISVSGWLVWREAGLAGAKLAFAIYAAQLVLNAAWSAIFFGMRRIDLALAEMVVFWLSIAATIGAFAQVSPAAAWLLAPYLAFVTFAGALNLKMWRLNAPVFPAVVPVKVAAPRRVS